MKKPIVAIVGRPNVGKSTLFNRLLGRKLAVVHGEPGVTRDRNIAPVSWGRHSFLLVDTGGYVPSAEVGMEALVREQVSVAIGSASVVVFLVDGETGVTSLDAEIAGLLREKSDRVILVVNKIDGPEREALLHEFHSLGMGEPQSISALHGLGAGELLERLVERLGHAPSANEDVGAVRIAVVGRPNVGKSSLVNRLLSEKRMVVDEAPGTTRDAVDSFFKYKGHQFILVDTAGLRRKRSVSSAVELYSIVRAVKSVERANVAFVLFDASAPLASQDTRIAALVHRSGKPSVIILNKWDLVEKSSKTAVDVEKRIRSRLTFLDYAPFVFVSALTGLRVFRLPEMVLKMLEQSRRELTDEEVTRALREATARRRPPVAGSGRTPVIKKAFQSSCDPPVFTVVTSEGKAFRKAYILYLAHSLRDTFGFDGVPIRLRFQSAGKRRREGAR
ncbi:MAG: ribosome biogenesis GTPase Der [Candidatus Eisenbacteria bacterium]